MKTVYKVLRKRESQLWSFNHTIQPGAEAVELFDRRLYILDEPTYPEFGFLYAFHTFEQAKKFVLDYSIDISQDTVIYKSVASTSKKKPLVVLMANTDSKRLWWKGYLKSSKINRDYRQFIFTPPVGTVLCHNITVQEQVFSYREYLDDLKAKRSLS